MELTPRDLKLIRRMKLLIKIESKLKPKHSHWFYGVLLRLCIHIMGRLDKNHFQIKMLKIYEKEPLDFSQDNFLTFPEHHRFFSEVTRRLKLK